MSTEIRVPQLPESVADATLVTWHKQPGDPIRRDENLADLETDKVVLEVPAPANGVVSEIRVPSGTVVTSGQILAVIEEGAAASTAALRPAAATAQAAQPAPSAPAATAASPVPAARVATKPDAAAKPAAAGAPGEPARIARTLTRRRSPDPAATDVSPRPTWWTTSAESPHRRWRSPRRRPPRCHPRLHAHETPVRSPRSPVRARNSACP